MQKSLSDYCMTFFQFFLSEYDLKDFCMAIFDKSLSEYDLKGILFDLSKKN